MSNDFERTEDDKYCDIFNSGYIIAKHEPDIFKLIEPSLDKDSPLLHGKQQYEIEQAKEYFKQFDRGDKGKDKSKDKDVDVKR